jgi:hypothetical protein
MGEINSKIQNMKNIFRTMVLLMFSILIFSCQENYFEGVVSYEMEYIDETGSMNHDEAKKYMGDKQVYFFKKNKYKSVMNGLLNLTLFYTGKDTLYNKIKGNNELLYLITTSQEEEVLSFEFKKSPTKVLGYDCDVLSVITTDGTMNYYFNKSLRLDKDLFVNHEIGFWSFCLDKTNGALPLKWEINTSGLILNISANEVENIELNDSIFQQPKSLKLTKG